MKEDAGQEDKDNKGVLQEVEEKLKEELLSEIEEPPVFTLF